MNSHVLGTLLLPLRSVERRRTSHRLPQFLNQVAKRGISVANLRDIDVVAGHHTLLDATKPDLDRLPGARLRFGQADRPSHLLAPEQIAQLVGDAALSLAPHLRLPHRLQGILNLAEQPIHGRCDMRDV